jgi:periplasmic protein TonB
MNRLLLTLCMVMWVLVGVAQTTDAPTAIASASSDTPKSNVESNIQNFVTPADSVFTTFDFDASFPGGKDGMLSFFSRYLRYPEQLKASNVTGEVVLLTIVNKKGRFSKIYIEKSLNKDLDMEAVRLLNIMPAWIPAEVNGRRVNSVVKIEVPFAIK